jgi:hypothetical protein
MAKAGLTEADFERAAAALGCDVAAIKAVSEVESRGSAFYDDGFPTILFERHIFHHLTRGKFSSLHPDISNPQPGGYGRAGKAQRQRFTKAFNLDPDAAMNSCSWGRFQIMGFNHKMAGYETVGRFVDAMKESEAKQLDAFVRFLKSTKADALLRAHDWAGFARAYNGPNYAKNRYDKKLAAAYKKFSAQTPAAASSHNPAESDNGPIGNEINQQPGNPQLSPPQEHPQQPAPEVVTIPAERPSLFTRIGAAITALTGIGINVGAIIQGKLEQMTPEQTAYLLGAIALIFIAIWWYRKSAKGAQIRTLKMMELAADPDRPTVILEKR